MKAKNKKSGEIREFRIEGDNVYISSNEKGFIMMGKNYFNSEWEVIDKNGKKIPIKTLSNLYDCINLN